MHYSWGLFHLMEYNRGTPSWFIMMIIKIVHCTLYIFPWSMLWHMPALCYELKSWHFWHMLDKTKVSCMVKHTFYFLWPLPFLHVYWEILYMLSPKICAKKVGVIKDKICILKNTRLFCFIMHMPKMSGYSNKSIFIFRN